MFTMASRAEETLSDLIFDADDCMASSHHDIIIKEPLPTVILRMPNTAFGISMGLGSHALMWKAMSGTEFISLEESTTNLLNTIFWYSSIIVFGLVVSLYLYKMISSFSLVKAEWLNESRCHFFNAPNLVFLLFLMSIPTNIDVSQRTLRICWGVSFSYQLTLTRYIYKAWMFSSQRNFSNSKPQFLMSIVGWCMLANLGQECQIKSEWGIGLPQMCFGAGFILYIYIMIFILSNFPTTRGMKGSPALFLLMAPPSVMVVSLDLFNESTSAFSQTAEMLLGWAYLLLMLLSSLGPNIWKMPSVLGEYWAYVFPLASATTATIRYALALQTDAAEVLAVIMTLISTAALVVVFGRMTFHIMYQCLVGKQEWKDPLFVI